MKRRNLIIILLILSIVTIFLGVSVAVFRYVGKGTTNNVIETGKIIFSYSDAEPGSTGNSGSLGANNPINITNAMPIPDEQGKLLSGLNEYFDFSVSASTTTTDLAYEITVVKQPNSTLEEERVKIYLTELIGDTERETSITGKEVVPTYNELRDTTSGEGKSVYFATVKAGEVAYGKNFRLRMWIKKLPTDGDEEVIEEEKEFTVKVNVTAVGNN